MNTQGYVERVQAALGSSWYKLRKIMGVSEMTLINWRKGRAEASEENALKIAEILKIDPALVFADLDIEHAKSKEVKAVRERIKEILQRSAVAVLVLFIYTGAAVQYGYVYYVK